MPKIRFQPTPNPNSLKFTADRSRFMENGMATFNSAAEAAEHPLGDRLFSIPGIANIFILPDFVTITKQPATDWDDILPKIEKTLDDYLAEHRTS